MTYTADTYVGKRPQRYMSTNQEIGRSGLCR